MTFYSLVHLQNVKLVSLVGCFSYYKTQEREKEQKTGNRKVPKRQSVVITYGPKNNCGKRLSWCVIEFISSTCFPTGAYDIGRPFHVVLYALSNRYESPPVKQTLSPIKSWFCP